MVSPGAQTGQTPSSSAALRVLPQRFRTRDDQLDSGSVECLDQLHQGVDVAADGAIARILPLDRGNGQA